MNVINSLADLRLKLIDLNSEMFRVKITSMATGTVFEYKPLEAEEWLNRYADSIINSSTGAVLLDVGGKRFKLTVWHLVPQRIDLTEI